MLCQKCRNCTFYTAYYKQWASGYGRLNEGFCRKHQKPQTQFETCGDFMSNEKKEEMREKRRLKDLDRAIESINEIAHILKEKEKQSDT